MARKAATRRSDLGRRASGETPTPRRDATPADQPWGVERALLAVLGMNAALSVVMLYVHAQLHATGGSYTSFCNVSNRVNCDVVLASAYATLAGIPIAALALATYLALVALVVWRGRAAEPM